MSYIMTHSKKMFDPLHPDVSLIDIEDIAHALSMLCRANGHFRSFYSVGQHCIWCAKEAQARGYDRRVVLACLLHDAVEAYMSDVPRPLKSMLPEYVAVEERLLHKIYEKYLGSDLTAEEAALVKAVDDDVLYYDLKELLHETMAREVPQMKVGPDYTVVPFAQVEEEYLQLFETLTFWEGF